MLKKALKLDQVHTFGDISKSQLVEKLDLMTEKAFFNQHNSKQTDSQTLIIVISLAFFGLLAESDKEHKKNYDEELYLKIPDSPDSTKLHKNMSIISWVSDRKERDRSGT